MWENDGWGLGGNGFSSSQNLAKITVGGNGFPEIGGKLQAIAAC